MLILSRHRKVNETELAADTSALCLRQQVAALEMDLELVKSRLLERNATLVAAVEEKVELEEELAALNAQEQGVVEEFAGIAQDVEDARRSGEEALRALEVKYKEDVARLRDACVHEHDALSAQVPSVTSSCVHGHLLRLTVTYGRSNCGGDRLRLALLTVPYRYPRSYSLTVTPGCMVQLNGT